MKLLTPGYSTGASVLNLRASRNLQRLIWFACMYLRLYTAHSSKPLSNGYGVCIAGKLGCAVEATCPEMVDIVFGKRRDFLSAGEIQQ